MLYTRYRKDKEAEVQLVPARDVMLQLKYITYSYIFQEQKTCKQIIHK